MTAQFAHVAAGHLRLASVCTHESQLVLISYVRVFVTVFIVNVHDQVAGLAELGTT